MINCDVPMDLSCSFCASGIFSISAMSLVISCQYQVDICQIKLMHIFTHKSQSINTNENRRSKSTQRLTTRLTSGVMLFIRSALSARVAGFMLSSCIILLISSGDGVERCSAEDEECLTRDGGEESWNAHVWDVKASASSLVGRNSFILMVWKWKVGDAV